MKLILLLLTANVISVPILGLERILNCRNCFPSASRALVDEAKHLEKQASTLSSGSRATTEAEKFLLKLDAELAEKQKETPSRKWTIEHNKVVPKAQISFKDAQKLFELAPIEV